MLRTGHVCMIYVPYKYTLGRVKYCTTAQLDGNAQPLILDLLLFSPITHNFFTWILLASNPAGCENLIPWEYVRATPRFCSNKKIPRKLKSDRSYFTPQHPHLGLGFSIHTGVPHMPTLPAQLALHPHHFVPAIMLTLG